MNFYLFTKSSNNKKTGPIPVTTSSKDTCPDNCGVKGKACYARFGPLGMHWQKLSEGIHKQRLTWTQFLERIASLPKGIPWRHNQAGDLDHKNGNIDEQKLKELTMANKGKKGFTYTHHYLNWHNLEVLDKANSAGFTINYSLDSIAQVDTFRDCPLPLVVILPESALKVMYTEKGIRIVRCPATWRDDFSCSKCDLCMRPKRDFVIGFPVHGTGKKQYKL